MRTVLASVLALVVGCSDSPGTGAVDGGNGGDGDGDVPGGDGGTGSPKTVKLTLPNRPTNAAQFSFLVAYQDGGAAWQLAPAPNGDTYSFEINAPSYGVAFTCIANVAGTSTSQLRSVTSAHFAVGERTELTLEVPPRCTDRNPTTVTFSGTVTNRPLLGGVFVVSLGGRVAYAGSQTGNFTLQTPPGTYDLVVSHVTPLGNGEFYVDEAVVARNVAVNGPTQRSVDFSAAESTQFYNVDAPFDARGLVTTTLYTANKTQVGLVRESGDWESAALHASQRATTDVYEQAIAVGRSGGGVLISNWTNAPGDQTYMPPAPFGGAAATVPTKTPYITLETTWPAFASASGYTWSAVQQLSSQQCGANSACTVAWTASVSPGVTGMSPGHRMPDLSALAGWKSGLQFQAGTQVNGSVTAFVSSGAAGDFPPATPAASGTKRTYVRADYSVTP